jgi:hypothetical protein
MNFDVDRLSRLSGLGPVESTGVLTESVNLDPVDVLGEDNEGAEIDECCGCGGNPDLHVGPGPMVGHGHSHAAPLSVSRDEYLFEMEEGDGTDHGDDDDNGEEEDVPKEAVEESILIKEVSLSDVLGGMGAPGLIARAVFFGESPVTDAKSAVDRIKTVVDSEQFDALGVKVIKAVTKAVANVADATGVLSTPEARAGALMGALSAIPGVGALAAAAVGAAASSSKDESSSPLTMETLRNTVLELRDEIIAEQAAEQQALTEAPVRSAIRKEIKALLAEMPGDAATNWMYGKKGRPSASDTAAADKSRATALFGLGFETK